ncbi:MAG TPA: hypothetical protein VEN79_12820 [Terriglobia bacterium]|nr:hypothetical protein [Terriglobia bacterium]
MESKPAKLHLSVGSSLAGFMLFAGLQSLILACRDPLAHASMRLLGRFIHSNALKIREMPTDWVYILGSVAFGLIFIIAAIMIGAVILRKRINQAV